MNKKVPEITESVETLKALLRKAIKKHEIQRLNTLYLLKSGVAKNRLQVADLLGVHRLSVGDWLSAYETGGLEKLLQRGYAPGRTPILTGEQQTLLRKELQKPEGFSSYEMSMWSMYKAVSKHEFKKNNINSRDGSFTEPFLYFKRHAARQPT